MEPDAVPKSRARAAERRHDSRHGLDLSRGTSVLRPPSMRARLRCIRWPILCTRRTPVTCPCLRPQTPVLLTGLVAEPGAHEYLYLDPRCAENIKKNVFIACPAI